MNESELLNEIDLVLSYFEDPLISMDYTVYKKYSELKNRLISKNLKTNPIKGSVRAYLDAHNDWGNPILITMGDLEDKIDLVLRKP